MFKKLSIFLLVLLFCSNAFAFCLFGLGDCGGKNFFIIDKNTTYIDQNITIGSVGGFYFPGLNLTLNDANFFAVDLNGFMNQSSFDSNVNSVIASIMPISDSNLSLPSVWAAIDGNAGSGSGAFYFPGASLTLDDDNFFHVNDANLNANLDFVNYNCDDNSDCALTGNVNSTTGEFVNLTVTGTSTIEEDLSVIGDFNAGITGSYPLIYKKAGGFSLFGSTVSGTASMGVGVLSIADGPYATAIGFEAEADGTSTIAMNNKSYAKGNYAMAFGNYASADGTDAVAIGLNADANISGGPGGCVAIGYEAECRDLGMVTLSKDVTIARDLEIGNCVTLNDKIICDWGDVNGTVPDLNGYMTELTFDSNITALDLNNSLDYLSSSTYIPTEEDIDANALAVINSLDLNNSLDYLVSGTYIPSENSIDANINEIIASRMPITDANLSIPNVWSAIDGNKSINTSCDNNADCTITGDVSGASGLPDGDVSWSVLNGIVPWVDANVADDITLTNITQITNRAFADITGKPIYYPYATPIGDANIDSASAWNAKLDWTQVNTVVPWVDENISNDLTVNGYVTDAVFNASTPIADGNISSATTWNNKLDWSQVSALFPVADENQTKTGDWTGTLDGYEASELILDTNAQTVCTGLDYLAGNGTCQTVSATGGEIGTFKGLTSTAMDGDISFDGNTGYVAANNMCDGNYAGTHWCSTDEIKASINDNNYISFPNAETAWTAEFAPGYLVNANDCVGMTSNTLTYLGAFWIFDTTRGGDAWLTNCANKKKLACCK